MIRHACGEIRTIGEQDRLRDAERQADILPLVGGQALVLELG
jgi:hypothetical protein